MILGKSVEVIEAEFCFAINLVVLLVRNFTEYESKKWTRATRRQRYGYIEAVLREVLLTRRIYYSVYTNSRAYVDLTTLSVAKAINTHTAGSYAATVLVDGLQRTEEHRFAREICESFGSLFEKCAGSRTRMTYSFVWRMHLGV